MPDNCSVYRCSNVRSIQTRARGITFHRFPKDTTLRRQWELAVKREGFVASKRSLLCSEHFKTDDFDRTGQIVRLREGVKPSVFNFPSHLQKEVPLRKTKTSQKAAESPPADLSQHFGKADSHSNVDHTYALPASPTLLKAKLNEALARVESLERKRRNSMLRERRAKKNVHALLEDLRKKNIINEDLSDRLECYSDLRVDLLAKKGHEYTREQREFALTLHLHGPKAYSYLRESQHLPLPHPHTLQRWLTSVDAKPGLNKSMLDMLGKRCEKDHTKYGLVTLILDAMAIKKHVQYNPQTQAMSGFVDMGDGCNETDVASEALVFMVVGLQGHWKAPIAYYLTSALSPETLKVLVVHALKELHDHGLRVMCMTMDGHASNISMCNQLGCNLKANPHEPLKTSFAHPVTGERVFVMMDACHMLKLARNMLQAYSPIMSTTGPINWKFVIHLNDVQTKDRLHAANKITHKHVHFDNQKMKVSLAAQTLSRSVAVALRTLRDLGYSQFQNCEATAEFIEMIDRLFDIFNSRNPRAKGFKAPLGTLNWSETVGFLLRARAYLLSLSVKDAKPLHQSKRYLSVIGFVVDIDTMMQMIPELLQVQRYVCTYRFSQDHLELLFNLIRASGGWNNNPSAGQFQGIFRRLMVRCGVSPSGLGNVAAQDDTVSLSAVEMSSAEVAEELPAPFVNFAAIVSDYSYLPTRFGGLVDNALVYIAGFVVRQILRSLSCLVRDAVPSSHDENYHLLELKNNGGLMIPSEGTVKVVRAAERVIRQGHSGLAPKVSVVLHVVREEIGTDDVFLLGEHIQDTQFGIDNHHSDLVQLVVSVFHKIRLHHIAKIITLKHQSGSTRKKLCKTVLFQGY